MIVTPERAVLESDNIEHVLLPAENGEVGILPRHIAMVCSLKTGRIRVDLPNESIDVATSGGFAEVLDDRITVLADTAEKAEEIDVERARDALERAREKLMRRAEKAEHTVARAALIRAINRLRVAGAT